MCVRKIRRRPRGDAEASMYEYMNIYIYIYIRRISPRTPHDVCAKSIFFLFFILLGAYTLLARNYKSKNPEAPLPPGLAEILVEV